jgi:formylglycine-generating enzyme required for sulfatase activity
MRIVGVMLICAGVTFCVAQLNFAQPLPAAASTTKINPRDGLNYVLVPAGKFQMGCSAGDADCHHDHGLITKRDDDELPVHSVTITKEFWLGQTPVTVAAFRKFSVATSTPMPAADQANPNGKLENSPMVGVSWNAASNYCRWTGGRLPTEAEWEYAARAGSTGARYGELDAIAWYRMNAKGAAHPVGQKSANAFGLYDMLGNAWQWTSDWYDVNYYQQSPVNDPQGPAAGKYHVLRGGSWFNGAADVRASERYPESPANAYGWYGVRCVWEMK